MARPLRRKRTLVTFPIEISPWVASRLCPSKIRNAKSKKISGSTMNGIALKGQNSSRVWQGWHAIQ
jgi:hypothetical protein